MTLLKDKPEVRLYGADRYKQGFEDGYIKSTLDRRKRVLLKGKYLKLQFGKFYDFLGDMIFTNKKH